MAYRNLTLGFTNQRDEFHHDTIIPIQTSKRQRLLDDNEIEIDDESPQWVMVLEDIDYDIKKIKELMKKLDYLNKQRSRINFENSYKEDSQIKDVMEILAKRFLGVNSKIKKLATIGNEEHLQKQLPFEERQLRINAMKSRGIKIQELSKNYRKIQKSYLLKLTREENESHNNKNTNLPDFSNIDQVGLTLEQQQQLKIIENDTNQRTKDIIAIAKSVQELLRLFNELSILIVEQGSLLDRIDYNVEKTVESLEKADKEIRILPKYQKRSTTALCILILILLIIFFAILLVVLKTV